jgi:hypothetical protein
VDWATTACGAVFAEFGVDDDCGAGCCNGVFCEGGTAPKGALVLDLGVSASCDDNADPEEDCAGSVEESGFCANAVISESDATVTVSVRTSGRGFGEKAL